VAPSVESRYLNCVSGGGARASQVTREPHACQHPYVTDWQHIQTGDFEVPGDRPLADLLPELLGMLRSPDPQVRDDTAFPVLATWTERGVLDGRLAELGDRLVERLGGAEIYERTFATLILAQVVLRDAQTGELDGKTVPGWLSVFSAWWRDETDLRGWDDQLGWLHAVAHGADTVRSFGRSPRLGRAGLLGLLDLVTGRMLTEHSYLWAHGEDDRVAYALATVLTRPELTAADATGWVDRVRQTIENGTPGPVPAFASNTLRTLVALYLYADRGVTWYGTDTDAPEAAVSLPHGAVLKDRIAAMLRLVSPGLG
jgi:hypothetical protein